MSLIAPVGVEALWYLRRTMALRLFILSVVLTAGLWTCPAQVQAASLYTGEVPVDQDESADRNALRALDQVLTRLTGIADRSLVEELGLDRSILRLLVSSEQRVRRSRVGPDGAPLADELRLRIDFDPAGVDALLARHDLPRLGRERPSILLWLAVEEETGIELQGGAYLEQEISEHARRLGLDVVRPLGDLIDLASIDVFDIRGGFLDSAEASARRYGTQVIAMLDLRSSDTGWAARWLWRLEGRDAGLQLEAEQASDLVSAGLNALLAALAERFAVVADDEHATQRRVIVRGIEGEIQYAEVLRHLRSLSSVSDVLVLAARGNELEFQLRLRASGLEDGLALGGVLEIEQRRADGSLELRLQR